MKRTHNWEFSFCWSLDLGRTVPCGAGELLANRGAWGRHSVREPYVSTFLRGEWNRQRQRNLGGKPSKQRRLGEGGWREGTRGDFWTPALSFPVCGRRQAAAGAEGLWLLFLLQRLQEQEQRVQARLPQRLHDNPGGVEGGKGPCTPKSPPPPDLARYLALALGWSSTHTPHASPSTRSASVSLANRTVALVTSTPAGGRPRPHPSPP